MVDNCNKIIYSIWIRRKITKMIKLDKNSVVYIASPDSATGGAKSLHQLADKLIESGVDVRIFYYRNGRFTGDTEVLFPFCKAKVILKDDICDCYDNVMIVPEVQGDLLRRFKKLRKCIWWLSLDFYLDNSLVGVTRNALKRRNLPVIAAPVIFMKHLIKDFKQFFPSKCLKKSEFKDIYHMYNCHYIKEYLIENGVPEDRMAYLCGPLEDKYYKVDFDSVKSFKENIVIYNPAKMNKAFLGKLEEELDDMGSDIKFVPIVNMNREQVYRTVRSAKVYVDFGFFPGPERMPREAVALYCNIITSTDGSAANDVDVPVPREFKFDVRKKESVFGVAQLILKMTGNYEKYVGFGDEYRQKVWNQIQDFDQTIRRIFVR